MSSSRSRPRDRAPARVGQMLRGKWHLDELLAVGGMASVFAATHRNGMRGAVKLLHYELSLDEPSRERFLREGYVANKVGHDGAVRVLDDDVCDDGTVFLVMELLEGLTVDALLRSRKTKTFGLGETLRIADRLLDTLAAAHDKGIVHRDIKPENLFLTNDGRLKVLDFGIARLREAHATPGTTRAGDLLGTPAFMPPEQALGSSEQVDARSDLWSVGATMFRLLTGRTVHHAESINRVLLAAMTMPAPPIASVLPTVPPALGAIIDRALAFAQAERWPDARAMRAALHAHATSTALRIDGPVQATPGEQRARPGTLPLEKAPPRNPGVPAPAADDEVTRLAPRPLPPAAPQPSPDPAALVMALPPAPPPAGASPPTTTPFPALPPPRAPLPSIPAVPGATGAAAPVSVPAAPSFGAPPPPAFGGPTPTPSSLTAFGAPSPAALVSPAPGALGGAQAAPPPVYTSPPPGVHMAPAPSVAPGPSSGPPLTSSPSFSTASPVSRDRTLSGPAPRSNPTGLFLVLGAAGVLGGLVAVVLAGSTASSSGAQPASAPEPTASASQSASPPPVPTAQASAEPAAPSATSSAAPATSTSSATSASASATAAVPPVSPPSASTAPKRPPPATTAKSDDPFSSRKW